MAFKFVVGLALVAVASAGLIPTAQVYQAAHSVLAKSEDSYDPHPQYQFSYGVQDAHTGDSKSQTEVRNGDVVQGEYSLIDADGYKRTVQYAADPIHGFNAVVNREPLGHAVAAPIAIKSAPVAYATAPAASLNYGSSSAYTQSYAAAAPAVINSAQVAYAAAPATSLSYAAAAPALIKGNPIVYSGGSAAYSTQSVIRASPLGYGTNSAYAAAPAYASYH